MTPYRTLRFVVLLLQLGSFLVMFVDRYNQIGKYATVSWWLVFLPIYGPVVLSISLLSMNWLYNRVYYTLFPHA